MTPAEQLAEWRVELVAEQSALEDELTTARQDQAANELQYVTASAEAAALGSLAASGVEGMLFSDGMAASLYGRVEMARRDALRAASGARGRAMARVKVLQEQVAGRQLGIRQIDAALTAAKVTALRPATEPKRRKPLIDFETIAMPTRETAQ